MEICKNLSDNTLSNKNLASLSWNACTVKFSTSCVRRGENEGHAQLLLGYPLVCFKLPCLFGTSTETDVALLCRIIYCTSWWSMEVLPGPSWSVRGTAWCLLSYDNYKEKLRVFCSVLLSFSTQSRAPVHSGAGGNAAGFCVSMLYCRPHRLPSPLAIITQLITFVT